MDFPVNELQKMFGKTPINLNSRGIAFENKKIRNILIITGITITACGIAYVAYQKGKKNSEQERSSLQLKIKEMETMKKESEREPSYQTKKNITRDPIVGLHDLSSLQAKKLMPDPLLKITTDHQTAKDRLKQKDEKIVNQKPIAINEDEFKS